MRTFDKIALSVVGTLAFASCDYLEPRELKGVLSQGMILMGQDATGKLVLLSPTDKVGSGTIVG